MLRAAAVAAALALAACQGIKDMMGVMTALNEHYHLAMNVNLNNGSHLVITLVNAPQADWADIDREAFAHEVAAFAKSHYAHPDALDDITVAFQSKSGAGPVTFTRGGGSYRWKVAELDTVSAPRDSTAAAHATR